MGQPFDSVLAAARVGADWAVAVLYREHHPRLLRWIRTQVPRADAEDVAGDVWLGIAAGLGDFEGHEAQFRSWLFTIARRRVADHHRRAGRRPVTVGDRGADVAVDDDAGAAVEAEEAVARIRAVLPPAQAEVVLLRVVAGLSADDVAALTGRTPGAVRVLQHKALKRLAAELAPAPSPGR